MGRNTIRIAPGARIQVGGRWLDFTTPPDLADYTPGPQVFEATITGTFEMAPEQRERLMAMARRAYREHLVRDARALCHRLLLADVTAWRAGDLTRFVRLRAIELRADLRLARRIRAMMALPDAPPQG